MASHIVSRRFLAVSVFITRRLFDRHFSWKVLGAFLVVVSGNDDVGTMEISERLFACSLQLQRVRDCFRSRVYQPVFSLIIKVLCIFYCDIYLVIFYLFFLQSSSLKFFL